MNSKSNQSVEARLRSISGSFTDDPTFAQHVLTQIQAEGVSSIAARAVQIRRYIMKGSIGLAASILIGLSVWGLSLSDPRPVFAVEDITQRILSLKSIHLKGVIRAPDGSLHPLEIFVQQPNKCRVSGQIISDPTGVTSMDEIIGGGQQIMLLPSKKIAVIQAENSTDVRYKVESLLQNEVQFIFEAADNFTKVRSEKIAGVQTDVYQGKVDQQNARAEIWFNPTSGLPVKAALYAAVQGKAEQAFITFDTIYANPSIDAAVFDPKIPADYNVIRSNVPTVPICDSSCNFGNMHLSVCYQVSLDRGEVLMCWYLFDDQHPKDDLKLRDADVSLTISSATGTQYKERLLHADATKDGYHWRWSVLHPERPPKESAAMISVVAKDAVGNTGIQTLSPVVFKPSDLAEQIKNLQRQTLAADQTPLTLPQIEQPLGPNLPARSDR